MHNQLIALVCIACVMFGSFGNFFDITHSMPSVQKEIRMELLNKEEEKSIDGSTIRYITMGDCPPDAEEILPMTIRINIGYCHNGQIDYRHETAGFSYKRLADLELCELAEPIEVPHFRITSLWWRITPIRTYIMGVKEKTDDKKTVWVYYTDENGEQQPVDSLYREHVPDKMAVKVMDHDKLECTIYLIREKNHYIVFESVMEP